MAIYLGNDKIKHINVGDSKIRRVYLGNTKIWSGASKVSYYDGDRFIGMEEIDEGNDVLHPNLDFSKDGYTHVGFIYNDGRVTKLKATGEPMTVKALYVINSIVVLTGTATQGYPGTFTEDSRNSEFISGNSFASASGWYAYNLNTRDTSYLTISLGDYGKATMQTQNHIYCWGGSGVTTINDVNYSSWAGATLTFYSDTTVKFYAQGSHEYVNPHPITGLPEGKHHVYVGATRITLSEPKAWE